MNKFGLAAVSAAILLAGATQSSALDRRVLLVNNTSYEMLEFYASNVGASTWEEDILGSGVLPSGYNVVVNIDDSSGYCKFDFRAVFNNGAVLVDEAVNVCEVPSFTYHD